jgi:hypothetical protein
MFAAHVCAFLCDGEPTMTPDQSYQVMKRPIKRVAASGDKENNKSSVALILKVTRSILLRWMTPIV